MMNKGLIPSESSRIGELIKSLCKIYGTEPNTTTKYYEKQIIVSQEKLLELNYKLEQKIENHNVAHVDSSVTILFESNKAIKFPSWEDFGKYSLKIPEVSRGITLRWEFIINDTERTLLMVNLSTYPTPHHILRSLFSNDADKVEKLFSEFAPCTARVDYVNYIFCEELLKIVDDWNSGLDYYIGNNNIPQCIREHRKGIARIVHYAIPITFFLLVIYFLQQLFVSLSPIVTADILKTAVEWLLIAIVGLFICERISAAISKKTYAYLDISGRPYIFDLTDGDRVHKQKIDQNNSKSFKKAMFTFGGAMVVPILAAIMRDFIYQVFKLFLR